ncbi:hypothetical protein [Pseudogracilibacillus sp. SO30301A]|uniref:hypothetical protein n=1 Tax=Pseudogracilibacillus sp. SO30301A TaxID=3098291 RepID=UPI00300E6025
MDKDEIIEGVNLLLSQVVLEKDSEFKETIFHTIHNAVVFNEVAADISLDILLPYCSGLSNENLSYVLSFLGFSGNEKYLATLRTYRNSPNKEIQTIAKEAINELRYRAFR